MAELCSVCMSKKLGGMNYNPCFTFLCVAEPPTRLEIRDTSPSRPISDQQIMMAGKNKHSDPTVIYMGPYTEGQDLTLVCSAYGGNLAKAICKLSEFLNHFVSRAKYCLNLYYDRMSNLQPCLYINVFTVFLLGSFILVRTKFTIRKKDERKVACLKT